MFVRPRFSEFTVIMDGQSVTMSRQALAKTLKFYRAAGYFVTPYRWGYRIRGSVSTVRVIPNGDSQTR